MYVLSKYTALNPKKWRFIVTIVTIIKSHFFKLLILSFKFNIYLKTVLSTSSLCIGGDRQVNHYVKTWLFIRKLYFLIFPPSGSWHTCLQAISKLMSLYNRKESHFFTDKRTHWTFSGRFKSDLYDKLTLINGIKNGDLDSSSRSSLILHLNLDIIRLSN